MRPSTLIRLGLLASAWLFACGGLPEIHQKRLFSAPPLVGEKVADLAAIPADLEIGADGAWVPVALAPDPTPHPQLPYRLNGETLLVPVARGSFEARIDRVLAPQGVPQVGWSFDAGMLAAAARGGSGQSGTILVAVRLGDGSTRVVASWEMAENEGYQGIEAMRISPDGAFLACQMVEHHPGGEAGFRAVARRGLVVPLGDAGGVVLDLGAEIDGPMRWSPDGRDLFYVHAARAAVLYRLRIPGVRPPGSVGARVEPLDGSAGSPARGSEAVIRRPPATSAPRATQGEVLEPIMQLSSGSAAEKVAAAQRLAGLPHPMVVGPLIQALDAGDPALCRAADEALRAIVTNPAPPSIGGAGPHDCSQAAVAWRDFWSNHPEALAG